MEEFILHVRVLETDPAQTAADALRTLIEEQYPGNAEVVEVRPVARRSAETKHEEEGYLP